METLYTIQDYLSLLQSHELLIDYKIPDTKVTVEYLSCNSKEATAGTLFVCKGANFKEQFLKDAMEKGSICYISEVKYDIDAPCIIVSDIRKTMAYVGDFYYGSAWQDFSVIGITGTKGKSTTSYFLKYILDLYMEAMEKPLSGVISTIKTFVGEEEYESHLTTPEPLDLHQLFATAKKHHLEYVEMEVSSQALKYDRTLGIRFDVAAFLNIAPDHISDVEHSDFADYFQSKLKIFEQCEHACINLNSDHLEEILEASKQCPKVMTFGVDVETADVYGKQVKKVGDEIHFTVTTPRYTKDFAISMPGFFNVQNALAAIAICEVLEIPSQYIEAGLKAAKVSGRMEVYQSDDKNIICIVDYAHNRLSFEKLFQSVKEEYPTYNVDIVFGCPGNKAFDRRKDLGEIAGQYANRIYLTEDDPGEEDIEKICREIGGHIKGQGNTYTVIADREQAIRSAVLESRGKTIVLLAGKGNDNTMRRGREYIAMPTDSEYAQTILEEYNTSRKK